MPTLIHLNARAVKAAANTLIGKKFAKNHKHISLRRLSSKEPFMDDMKGSLLSLNLAFLIDFDRFWPFAPQRLTSLS